MKGLSRAGLLETLRANGLKPLMLPREAVASGQRALARIPGAQDSRAQVAAVTLLAVMLPLFPFMNDYLVRLIGLSLVFAMLGVGLNIVTGVAGLLDLGYAAFFGVSSYFMAILLTGHMGPQIAFWWLLPGCVVIAGLAGIMVGFPAIRMRGDYLAVTTLAFGEIAFLLFSNLDRAPPIIDQFVGKLNITNGINGIILPKEARPEIFGHVIGKKATIGGLTLSGPDQLFWLTLVLFAVVAWYAYRLQRSRIGRAWDALRENEIAAVSLGVNRFRLKLLAFVLGASTAGWAGAVNILWVNGAYPSSFILFESIFVLLIVVLGGRGSILGVVLASLLLFIVPEYLQFAALWRHVMFGAVLVVLMLFRPQGLLGRQEYETI